MNGYSVTSKSGRAESGQFDCIYRPRTVSASKYPIVGGHGANAQWWQWIDVGGFPRMQRLLAEAARGGICGIGPQLGGTLWGNSSSNTKVGDALTAVATATGCSSTKAHLVGASMGAQSALQYALNNPTKVATMTLLIPAVNLNSIYKSNPPTGTEANGANNFWSSIATAWGVANRTVTDAVTNGTTTLTSATAAFTGADVGRYVISKSANGIAAGTTIASITNGTTAVMSAAASTSGSSRIVGIGAPLPAGADVLSQAATLSAIPTKMYYAPDDTIIVPSDVTALATAMGANATATATDGGGHTDAGMLPTAFDFDTWVAWLVANGG